MEEESKKKKLIRRIIIASVMIIIPIALGIILAVAFERPDYAESVLVGFAIIYLITIFTRSRLRDSRNWRANKTVFNDKKSKDYIEYRKGQWVLFYIALFLLASSLIIFMINNPPGENTPVEEDVSSLVIFIKNNY